jgi:replicative DNA helicase
MSVKNQSNKINEFEQNKILASIIKFGKDGYVDCSDLINEGNFDGLIHKFVFSSFEKIFNENLPFTLTSVYSKCIDMGLQEKDFEKIKEITDGPCETLEDVRPLASRLRKKKIITDSINLHRTCINSLSELKGDESISSVFSISETAIFDLVKKYTDSSDNPELIKEFAREILDDFIANPTLSVGLPTPWPEVTKAIGNGLRKGGIYLFGARSGVGKSFLLQIISIYLAKLKIPVLILDTEMTKRDILPRLLSNLSEISINDIESGVCGTNDFSKNKVYTALDELENSPLHYITVAGKEFDEILSTIRRWIYTHVGINEKGVANDCLVCYDYFKLMNTAELQDLQETQALGFNISKLADFAKKYDFPILTATQLNRDGVTKETSDVISASDRLLWLVTNFSIFKLKTLEEMQQDGFQNGNRKFISVKSRFGGEHQFGQYVSMQMKADLASILEIPSAAISSYKGSPDVEL